MSAKCKIKGTNALIKQLKELIDLIDFTDSRSDMKGPGFPPDFAENCSDFIQDEADEVRYKLNRLNLAGQKWIYEYFKKTIGGDPKPDAVRFYV
jgi:hypothetical protein